MGMIIDLYIVTYCADHFQKQSLGLVRLFSSCTHVIDTAVCNVQRNAHITVLVQD